MTYQVLARKWRPRGFAEMVGQSHVLRALSNGLANGRLHHAYLFTGTRGVGKTTIARILAKCLNCEGNGVTDTPCGCCAACAEIDAGRFVDLIEVDAASRTRVEDTRELLDNVQYAPSRGRFKIYLIDEVHMLSSHSFNALLKTLEEPPDHVKFLLATTDPQKLPVTVLSRCLQFNLKPLLPDLIGGQIEHIAAAEKIDVDANAVRRLAMAADGSMRDALSLMDQALAFGSGALRDQEVADMLGSLEQDFLFDLLECLAQGDGAGLVKGVERLADASADFSEALADLLVILHQLTLAQTVPGVIANDSPDGDRLERLSQHFDSAGIQLLYQIALHGRRDLPMAPDPRAGFEMTMLRMLAFQPDWQPGNGTESAPPPAKASKPVVERKASAPEPEPSPSAAPPAASESTDPAPTKTTHVAPSNQSTDWHQLVPQLGLSGVSQALANHCEWVGREGDRITLQMDADDEHLANDNAKTRLTQALCDYFNESLSVMINVGALSAETPADAAARARAEKQSAAQAAIEADPNIAALKDTFGAEVISDSIRPNNQESE